MCDVYNYYCCDHCCRNSARVHVRHQPRLGVVLGNIALVACRNYGQLRRATVFVSYSLINFAG